jgi:hypothetical protein
VATVGMPKAGGTISQQAVVHPWLAADAHGNKLLSIAVLWDVVCCNLMKDLRPSFSGSDIAQDRLCSGITLCSWDNFGL